MRIVQFMEGLAAHLCLGCPAFKCFHHDGACCTRLRRLCQNICLVALRELSSRRLSICSAALALQLLAQNTNMLQSLVLDSS